MDIKNDFKIRKIKPEDILALHNVYFLTWLDTYPNEEFNITKEDIVYKFEQRLAPEKIAESKAKILQTKNNELKLLVEDQGKVIALCNAVKNPEYNQLQAIYVLPEYQGVGIGKSLWLEVEKFLNPHKKTIVRVALYNKKAIEFYKKIGFEVTDKIIKDEKFKMLNGAVIPEIEMVRLVKN